MLHVGTLLLDDIQDDTEMRRDTPAAHLVYGVPITTNASLQVIILALEKLLALQHPKVLKFIGEIISNKQAT
ncbi:unnamed protein product [Leptidea sinapis]|uniref:Uncharacterized protein n=1 Tax=Leptidea sinapis TaxID=189913 RepID=A0A5E4QPV8_9NEOP|nr:unnamed protein product [Leptidea sinapis]